MKSNAKINLGLKIVNKRQNGMHQLQTVIVPVSLYDKIRCKITRENKIEVKASINTLNGENNICYKVAKFMKEKYQIEDGIKIYIKKNIPLESGLGGGSGNAAEIIKFYNKKYFLNLSKEEMIEIASQVGSDVSFFILNTPSYVSGLGEVIEPLKTRFNPSILLVKPPKGLSTKDVYKEFDDSYQITLQEFKVHDQLINNNQPYSYIYNDLENPAKKLSIEVSETLAKLAKLQQMYCGLSGSGSCCYALFENKKKARKAARKLKTDYLFVHLVQIINKD